MLDMWYPYRDTLEAPHNHRYTQKNKIKDLFTSLDRPAMNSKRVYDAAKLKGSENEGLYVNPYYFVYKKSVFHVPVQERKTKFIMIIVVTSHLFYFEIYLHTTMRVYFSFIYFLLHIWFVCVWHDTNVISSFTKPTRHRDHALP